MAVWTYSPAKRRPQSGAVTTTASYLNRHLTNDLIGIVFEYLVIADLAVASQVCRGWFVSADPWTYVEQHGWVPLGPLTRATSAALRFAPTDHHVAPQLLKCLRHHCENLVLHLGNGVVAASVALPPYAAGSEDAPAFTALTTLTLERPSPEDLRMMRDRLAPRLPALRTLSIDRISLPIGARDIVALVRACKSSPINELRLSRVTNLTRSSFSEIFAAAPALTRIVLDQCVVALDNNSHPPGQNVFRPNTSNPTLSGRPVAGVVPPPTICSKIKATIDLIPSEASVWGYIARRATVAVKPARDPQRARRPALLTPDHTAFHPNESPRSRSVQPPPQTPMSECIECLIQGMPCSAHLPSRPPPVSVSTFVTMQQTSSSSQSHQQQLHLHNHNPTIILPTPPMMFGQPNNAHEASAGYSAHALPRFPAPPPVGQRPFIPVHMHGQQSQQHHHQHRSHAGASSMGSQHGYYASLPPLIAVPPTASGSRPIGVAGSLWGAPSLLRPAPPPYIGR